MASTRKLKEKDLIDQILDQIDHSWNDPGRNPGSRGIIKAAYRETAKPGHEC
jgi:hypothetical protein